MKKKERKKTDGEEGMKEGSKNVRKGKCRVNVKDKLIQNKNLREGKRNGFEKKEKKTP